MTEHTFISHNRISYDKNQDLFYFFRCCGRCPIDECEPEHLFFTVKESEEIAAMTQQQREKLSTGVFENKPWFRIPEPDWKEEIEKCKASPYYWYTNYCYVHTVDGPKLATTRLSEEDFNKLFQGYMQGKEQPITGEPD